MLTLLSGRLGLVALLSLVLAAALAQEPLGATFAAADTYRLPAGVVVPTDLYIVANSVEIEGEVQGHLAIIARRAVVSGTVLGSANLLAARIELQGARLGVVRTIGAALTQPQTAPSGGAGALPVRYGAQPPDGSIRDDLPERERGPGQTLLVAVGFAILAATMLALTPRALARPADALEARPWRTLFVGLLAVMHFLLIPLATIALALLVAYFWDWFAAVLLAAFVFAGFGLLVYLSPLVTGVWAGRWLNRAIGREAQSRPALVLGVVLVALVGSLPAVGWMVYLASFILAVGAIAVASAGAAGGPRRAAPAAAVEAPAPAVAGADAPPAA